MGDIKLSTPRVMVIREGLEHEPPLEVQTDNRDLVRYDKTRPKQRPPWPDPQTAPSFWLTFIAWSAANRQGAIPAELTYERWEAQVLNIQSLDDDEEEDGAPFPEGEQGAADL